MIKYVQNYQRLFKSCKIVFNINTLVFSNIAYFGSISEFKHSHFSCLKGEIHLYGGNIQKIRQTENIPEALPSDIPYLADLIHPIPF